MDTAHWRRDLSPLGHAGLAWYVTLTLVVVGAAGVDHAIDSAMFWRFIGDRDPALIALGMSALGGLLLRVLVTRDGFLIAGPRVWRGVLQSTGLAALFGAVIIVADVLIVHPADMNVPFPQSLVFYPVIGFVGHELCLGLGGEHKVAEPLLY